MRRAFLCGNSRSLMAGFVILAALAISLALLFSSTKPAIAKGKTVSSEGTRLHCFICDAVVSRSPASLNFGKVRKHHTKRLDVKVTGIQDGATLGVDFPGGVNTPTIDGSGAGAFSIANNGCNNAELDPGEVCTITVAFTPPRKGLFTATMTIPPKARTQFQGSNTVDLSGKGVRRR